MQHYIRRSVSKLLLQLLFYLLILPSLCFPAFIEMSPPGGHNPTSSLSSRKQFLPKRVNIFITPTVSSLRIKKERKWNKNNPSAAHNWRRVILSTHFSCGSAKVLTYILCTRLEVLSWGRCRSSSQSSRSTKRCHSRQRWPTEKEGWSGWWSVEA